MEDKIISKLKERKENLLKNVIIIDKMIETKDFSLLEKQYWDDLVENFDKPQNIDDAIEDGLTPEEIECLNNLM